MSDAVQDDNNQSVQDDNNQSVQDPTNAPEAYVDDSNAQPINNPPPVAPVQPANVTAQTPTPAPAVGQPIAAPAPVDLGEQRDIPVPAAALSRNRQPTLADMQIPKYTMSDAERLRRGLTPQSAAGAQRDRMIARGDIGPSGSRDTPTAQVAAQGGMPLVPQNPAARPMVAQVVPVVNANMGARPPPAHTPAQQPAPAPAPKPVETDKMGVDQLTNALKEHEATRPPAKATPQEQNEFFLKRAQLGAQRAVKQGLDIEEQNKLTPDAVADHYGRQADILSKWAADPNSPPAEAKIAAQTAANFRLKQTDFANKHLSPDSILSATPSVKSLPFNQRANASLVVVNDQNNNQGLRLKFTAPDGKFDQNGWDAFRTRVQDAATNEATENKRKSDIAEHTQFEAQWKRDFPLGHPKDEADLKSALRTLDMNDASTLAITAKTAPETLTPKQLSVVDKYNRLSDLQSQIAEDKAKNDKLETDISTAANERQWIFRELLKGGKDAVQSEYEARRSVGMNKASEIRQHALDEKSITDMQWQSSNLATSIKEAAAGKPISSTYYKNFTPLALDQAKKNMDENEKEIRARILNYKLRIGKEETPPPEAQQSSDSSTQPPAPSADATEQE